MLPRLNEEEVGIPSQRIQRLGQYGRASGTTRSGDRRRDRRRDRPPREASGERRGGAGGGRRGAAPREEIASRRNLHLRGHFADDRRQVAIAVSRYRVQSGAAKRARGEGGASQSGVSG